MMSELLSIHSASASQNLMISRSRGGALVPKRPQRDWAHAYPYLFNKSNSITTGVLVKTLCFKSGAM